MKFTVFIIQPKKIEKFYLDALKEYEKRLSRYCKIKLIRCKTKQDLLKKLPENSYKISITSGFSTCSSEDLAQKINNYAVSGNSTVSLVIGDHSITYDETLAISPMDIADGLLATIVYEQIYRAYRILNNQPYHK